MMDDDHCHRCISGRRSQLGRFWWFWWRHALIFPPAVLSCFKASHAVRAFAVAVILPSRFDEPTLLPALLLIVTQCRVLDCISLPCTRFWVIWPHALKPSLSVFEETTPGGSFCRPGSFLAQFDKWSPANQSNQPPPTYLNAATPAYHTF